MADNVKVNCSNEGDSDNVMMSGNHPSLQALIWP